MEGEWQQRRERTAKDVARDVALDNRGAAVGRVDRLVLLHRVVRHWRHSKDKQCGGNDEHLVAAGMEAG